MDRIEIFTQDDKNFVYLDLSEIKTNEAFLKVTEDSTPVIRSYGERGVYTITNIANVTFDSKTKKIAGEWTKHNEPYVKYGVIMGMDSIRKIMVKAVLAISGRKNMGFASTREEAIEWLLKQP